MKDLLQEIFENVNNWLRFAEAKNAALLTFSSACVTIAVGRLYDKDYTHLRPSLLAIAVAAWLAAIVSLISFLPVLKEAARYLAFKRGGQRTNLLFFGDIMHIEPDAYMKQLADRYGVKAADKALCEDLARQVVINSRIAMRKFLIFNIAALALLGGFVIGGGLAFFKN